MSTPTIILTVGIPASGKDTWAREVCEANPDKYVVVNRDKFRKDVFTTTGSIHDYKYTRSKEKEVTTCQEWAARHALSAGKSVIVSDTNLNNATCLFWEELAKKCGVPLTYQVMSTPLYLCIKRNAKRADFVPESVLIRMETKMRKRIGKYVHNPLNPNNLPECVICDIDGTLATMEGVRGPFDWDKVGLDKPRDFVCSYVRTLKAQGVKVFIFSGRDSVCRELTELWLAANTIQYDELYMRETGSTTNDTLVKEKMFDTNIKGKYHVSHVIDDRHAVVNMWCSMGFNVVDVGNRISDF